MSIVLVAFAAAPKTNPEVVEREKKIEAYIERRTRGLIPFQSFIYLYIYILHSFVTHFHIS